MIVLLSACGNDVSNAPKSEPEITSTVSSVTITFAVRGNERAQYKQLAEQFHQIHPEIQVQIVSSDQITGGDQEGALDKLTARADTFTFWRAPMPEEVQKGLLRDLQPFVELDSNFAVEDFFPGALDFLRDGEHLWGVPGDLKPLMLFYDKTAFDEAGLPYPQPGWSYNDLEHAAQALTVRNNNEVLRYGLVIMPSSGSASLILGRALEGKNPETITSYLDLNGKTVYFGEAMIDNSAIIIYDGGSLVQATYAWTEDFDSYDTVTQLPDQSDWEAWGGDPAASDFYASTAQGQSDPNSVAIDDIDDAVHQYSGYTESVWEYKASVYVPYEMDDIQMLVLVNTYPATQAKHWSCTLELDGGAGVVRDHNGPDSLPLVKGQWVEVRYIIDLDADQQKVYYDDVHLLTKGWSDGVAPGGAMNIAAVDLWGNESAHEVYYDDLALAEGEWQTCPADINGDEVVDVLDLLAVLSAWGAAGGVEDVNEDGVVDVLDLLVVLSAWGPC